MFSVAGMHACIVWLGSYSSQIAFSQIWVTPEDLEDPFPHIVCSTVAKSSAISACHLRQQKICLCAYRVTNRCHNAVGSSLQLLQRMTEQNWSGSFFCSWCASDKATDSTLSWWGMCRYHMTADWPQVASATFSDSSDASIRRCRGATDCSTHNLQDGCAYIIDPATIIVLAVN